MTHIQRERVVLNDLEASFPDFTGRALLWTEVQAGQDPPDFIARGQSGPVGLELVEWLDGVQMTPAKTRESQREHVQRVLAEGWERKYRPQNFRGAFPSPVAGLRIAPPDEAQLRGEFHAHAADVDRAWLADPDRWGSSDCRREFPGYPLLTKYFTSINFVGGEPLGLCWIRQDGDGGAIDPYRPVETLKQAMNSKLGEYSTPEKQAHLKAHGLIELDLLLHGGFNCFAYNTSSGHLTLEDIAQYGADYYAAHPQRHIFDRVWFFHSLDTADDLNQLIGFAPDEGRVRWLAQLWPDLTVYPGSIAA
jgi:hypothetical protein